MSSAGMLTRGKVLEVSERDLGKNDARFLREEKNPAVLRELRCNR